MYAAVTCPGVSRCVSFDGQGFGSAFLRRYSDGVAGRRGLITAHNLDGDFVSPLLAGIAGTVNYVAGSGLGGFLANHSPISLLSISSLAGGPASLGPSGPRSVGSGAVGGFSAFVMDQVPDEHLRPLALFLGTFANWGIGHGDLDAGFQKACLASPEGLGALLAVAKGYPDKGGLAAALAGQAGSDAALGSNVAASPLSALLFSGGTAASSSPLGRRLAATAWLADLSNLDDLRVLAILQGVAASQGFDEAWVQSAYASYIATGQDLGEGEGSLREAAGTASPTVRDFSEAKKQELLSIVGEIDDEPWFDPTKWDAWYRVESWFGRLSIDSCQHDMNEYFRKVMDVNDTSAQDIEDIFSAAVERDRSFAQELAAFVESLQAARRLADSVLA